MENGEVIIRLSKEEARILDAAFLPRNPNKLRKDKEVSRDVALKVKDQIAKQAPRAW